MICFEGALELDPGYTFGLHRLAHIRRIQGRIDESLSILKTYLSCGGDTVTAMTEKILSLEAAGRFAEADSVERTTLELYPEAWLDAAWNSYYMDDDEETANLCRRFEAGDPVDTAAWIAVGDLYSYIERMDDSDRCYAEAAQ